jgi:hypothetical protein
MACEDPTIAIPAIIFWLFIFISIRAGFDKKK